MNQEAIDRTLDTLQAPYPERILRIFRAAMIVEDPGTQAERVVQVIADLGLEPYQAPEPLPDITEDDVNLICWMAIVPKPTDLPPPVIAAVVET